MKGSVKIKISPSEAQKIAETYVKEPGAKVGIPQLDEVNGQMMYIVPIEINGSPVGEITINAVTGENMGGAGGAP
ncbi:MAG: PepSY domain-containing protein [Methanobacteriaceae archaeon]|nr:PepSY domain-containing protein [Methanobacteriaceae archaeon]